MFLGRCYKFYQQAKTWIDAHVECKKQGKGGHLARPKFFAEVSLFSKNKIEYGLQISFLIPSLIRFITWKPWLAVSTRG